MAACCSGEIGALNVESFGERVLSCANLVVDEGNALLDDKYITIMLVVLRMSRAFMQFSCVQTTAQSLVPPSRPLVDASKA